MVFKCGLRMNFILACAMLIFSFLDLETDLVDAVNRKRETYGVAALAFNWEAARLARYNLEKLVGLKFFGYDLRTYCEPDEMLVRFDVPFTSAGVGLSCD